MAVDEGNLQVLEDVDVVLANCPLTIVIGKLLSFPCTADHKA